MQDTLRSQSFFLVDDHTAILNGTAMSLKQEFPEAEIAMAQTAQEARQKLATLHPDLIIVDLSLPETKGATCRTETGINLLREFLEIYETYNFVVQSANVMSLVRIKPSIDAHQGGFAGTRQAHQAKNLAFGDGKTCVFHAHDSAKPFKAFGLSNAFLSDGVPSV